MSAPTVVEHYLIYETEEIHFLFFSYQIEKYFLIHTHQFHYQNLLRILHTHDEYERNIVDGQ